MLAHPVQIEQYRFVQSDQKVGGFHVSMREPVFAHSDQILNHRAQHLFDLVGIRSIVQGICSDAVASMFIDKPGFRFVQCVRFKPKLMQ